MKSRKQPHWLLLLSSFVLAVCLVVFIGESRWSVISSYVRQAESPVVTPTPTPTPPPREAIEFRMTDFDHGWVRYADGTVKTEDGGETWLDAGGVLPSESPSSTTAVDKVINELMNLGAGSSNATDNPLAITMDTGTYPVKQSQFLTARIGWALLADPKDAANVKSPLLVTADGGQTWNEQITPAVKDALLKEKDRLQKLKKEVALYASADIAKAVIGSKWKLVPDTASPGDVVLVRRDEPGSVTWLGKTYTLQPFGAGYFTYLPITMQAKPGKYPISDETLTIQAKKFDTQYLKVTEQMESMKQDTGRIQADQKKIDLARSKSEPEFLFSGPFVQPIEGVLTTPYGYTRYVNGKYDSSHMAIDLAAKEGTPIKATNDGVVALADALYLTGNSIYIDHGMGLFSQYAHLSELRVKAGDRVKVGDIIGLVGTTGFSTGPHLHFTFWAHNVQANPNLFFNTTPFQWQK
ncbi:M23 family metallopeptidase [Paenibacillus sp. SI8]|uniref:M23 family metallopeptidase n=1 Tax=unclassified Paenibacillus TaxID=185978 RepID=UPI003465958C